MIWRYVQRVIIPDADVGKLKAFLDAYYVTLSTFAARDISDDAPIFAIGSYRLILTSDPKLYPVDIESYDGVHLGLMELVNEP